MVTWDDQRADWAAYDLVVIRSPWDYPARRDEFVAWAARVPRLLNPADIIAWNTDKHYLRELAAAGIPVTPTDFIEPPPASGSGWSVPESGEWVVKPAISAGSRDTQRYARSQEFAASNHIARLLEQARSVMLQPYLASVDSNGETALVYFDGQFSHAIRKGPLLRPDEGATEALFAAEAVSARVPGDDERAVASAVLGAMARLLGLSGPLPYARVDLILDAAGKPCLLELELTEPSLFFSHAPGSADDFANRLAKRLAA